MYKYFIPIILVFFISCSVSDNDLAKLVRIIDGDTIVVKHRNEEQRVRLIGIDTPESRINTKLKKDALRSNKDIQVLKELGKAATLYVKSKIKKGDLLRLEFDVKRKDHYGRLLAYVYLPNNKMLNEIILLDGYGQVYTVPPNVKYQARLLKAERYAKTNNKGLWSSFIEN